MPFDLNQYLTRVGLTDVPSGAAGLVAVQRAQMSTIPFENIQPLLGEVPDLSPIAIIDKLIACRRGGYCFEQNALLAMALSALGYTSRIVLARVRNGAAKGGARSHQTLLVDVDGQDWLCDAGFGGHGALHPLCPSKAQVQVVPNGSYRFRLDTRTGETVLETNSSGDWTSLYGYDVQPVQQIDIEAANYLCATWDKAPFRSNLMMALHGPNGRAGLFNRALTQGGQMTILSNQEALSKVLRNTFQLVLTASEVTAIWNRIKDAPTRR